MLDIELFRAEKGGNPDLIKESQRKRNASVTVIDEIIELDKEWRNMQYSIDEFNRKINAVQKQIGAKMKAKENADDLKAEKVAIEKKRDALKSETDAKVLERDAKLSEVGNLVHESVIDNINEDFNDIVKVYPEGPLLKDADESLLFHHEIMERLGMVDLVRGANIAGHRGYYLKNDGLRLNQALISYSLDFLQKRQYNLLQTPFFMKKSIMAKTAQLSQFDEELYKVSGDGDDKYLIATSEQPISAYHMEELINPKVLPLRYGGYSTCFRKEAGAHGKDVTGIFRIHQFEKIEQFCLTDPEKSWEMFLEMSKTAEEFYQTLGLKYRVVSIVSGALNNAAAKKHDLEAWFPRSGRYRELVSCSNCTDYQSRRLDIKFGGGIAGKKDSGNNASKFVHCLNATLCATERTMCCIVENYQEPGGVRIPKVLQPYMGGKEFLPFLKEGTK